MQAIITKNYYTRLALSIALTVVIALIGFIVIGRQAYAESAVTSADTHIITVHDDGIEKGLITKKSTLREALHEAGIRVDSKDRTEPHLDEKLTAASYQANIYRARPVLIRDGVQEIKIITSYRTGKQVAKDAGLTLADEDVATLETSKDIATTGAPEILTVQRAAVVNVVFYGKPLVVRTLAHTIADMLKQKGITPAADDTLMPAAKTPIVAGMTVELWKNGEQTVTAEEEIVFETQQIRDASKDKGFKEVQTQGVNGKKTVTYKITMQNGKEVKRDVVNSVTTKEPVKQVETVGTKVELPAGSHSDWMRAAGIAESDFGIAEWLIQKESGWNPNAVNKSSGACGLVQALPCSKLGPNWNDPVVALRWGDAYVKGRYGGWSGAYAFWTKNRWY